MATRDAAEIRSLGDTWNDTMLWYARPVHVLREGRDQEGELALVSLRCMISTCRLDQPRISRQGRSAAKADERKTYEPVPAPDLVFPAVAPRLSAQLRRHRARRHQILDGPADWRCLTGITATPRIPTPGRCLRRFWIISCPTGRPIRCLPRPGMARRWRRTSRPHQTHRG